MKYFVESYGCTMNYGEGRQLSEKMSAMGHEETDCADDADIVVLNTCTVVDTTEKKMISRMSELKRSGKEIIVTGCMAKVQANRINIRLPESLVIPPDGYHDFSDTVSERYGHTDAIDPPVSRACCILPIAQGCMGNCTYCITRYARGSLKSYDPDELVSDFRKMIGYGAKEILIAAQDTACYGSDIGTDLPTLLKRMLQIEGEYRVRIGMMNPNSLDGVLDDLLDVMGDTRVYRFLHIPVQSGSDPILDSMRRGYTVDKFMSIIRRTRDRYPEISIATDVISGFPGETESDHRLTVSMIQTLRADTINITRFSARPGTEAAMMPPVHGRISKERSTELTSIKNETEYDVNSKLIGRIFTVLVTETGKDGTMIARTQNYRPVALDCDLPIGTFVSAEITNCASTYLIGRVLNN